MIKLKIEKIPEYLSPSSLGQAEGQPNTFYGTRLIEDKWQKEEQSIPAAMGSSFDCKIKVYLMNREENPIGDKQLIPMILKGVERDEPEVEESGNKILGQYHINAIDFYEWVDIEIWKKFWFRDVKIFGKLDAIIRHEGLLIPHDWKCSGFNSKHGVSPKPGFRLQFIGDEVKGAHKKYRPDITIEEIDETWAKQFTTYGWAMGYSQSGPEGPDWEDFYVSCDMITLTKTKVIKISSYLAIATIEYQKRLYLRYKKIWDEIRDGSYIRRLASEYDNNINYTCSKWESWF